jgi:hypothetical protein
MLDGSHHQVTHVLAADTACGSEEAHGFSITAVQGKSDPHLLAIVAADFEAVRAPASIAFIHRDPTVVPPLDTADMTIKQ